MTFYAANQVRLSRVIQGFMDADLIRPEEGSSLLDLLGSAGTSLDHGDLTAAGRAAARLIQALEDLTGARALDPSNGQVAIDLARRLLVEPAG